jgi:hypothetical protein
MKETEKKKKASQKCFGPDSHFFRLCCGSDPVCSATLSAADFSRHCTYIAITDSWLCRIQFIWIALDTNRIHFRAATEEICIQLMLRKPVVTQTWWKTRHKMVRKEPIWHLKAGSQQYD